MTYRIGIVYYPKLDIGGVEVHILTLLERLPKEHFEPVIISEVSEQFKAQADKLDIQIIPWQVSNPLSLKSYLELRQIIHDHSIDLIHIHNSAIALPIRIITAISSIPTILTQHLILKDYFATDSLMQKAKYVISQLVEVLENYLFPQNLIFVSKTAGDFYHTNKLAPAKKVYLIPNGIDLKKYSKPQNKYDFSKFETSPDDLKAIFVGRFEYQKGIDVLLNAAKMAAKTIPNLKIFLVGTGSLEQKIRETITALKLQKNIILLGYIENPTSLLQSSDMFILPSRFEGLPLSLIEAAASGLPIICSDVGDNKMVVHNNENGLLFKSQDARELAAKIEALAVDPQKREAMGKKSLQLAKQFDASAMASKVSKIYLDMLNK